MIEELRDLGVIVSIDDFGAGVTSLAYLSSLAVGELKLDRTFITGLVGGESDRDLDLVRSTIELGHAHGIAHRGRRHRGQRHARAARPSLGCDVAQGYCISRPKPASRARLPGAPGR